MYVYKGINPNKFKNKTITAPMLCLYIVAHMSIHT